MRFTVRQLFVFLVFIALFMMAVRNISDPDFWWHLRTGQIIFETHTIPHADPFSYTNPEKPWIAHEWLSDLIIYSLYITGGYGLLIITFAAIMMVSFWILYLRITGKPYIAGFLLIWGYISIAPIMGVRPQIFTILFASLFLHLLEKYKTSRDPKYLLFLPPAMILWVNLHGGFALGLAFIALTIIGEVIETLRPKPVSKRVLSVFHQVKWLLVVFITSIAVIVINPNGLKMLVYPLETLRSPAMQQNIQEWLSPDFHLLQWQPFALLLITLLAVLMLIPGKVPISKTLLLLAFGYSALRSARNIPFFVLLVIPVIAEKLELVFGKIQIPKKNGGPVLITVINYLLLLAALGILTIQTTVTVQKQGSSEESIYPLSAVNWITSNQLEANLFSSYEWGGYLIWKLYPEYKVYIDGRADVYGDVFIEQFLNTYQGKGDWEQVMDSDGVSTILLPVEAPLVSTLIQSADWINVYQDQKAIIFTRR